MIAIIVVLHVASWMRWTVKIAEWPWHFGWQIWLPDMMGWHTQHPVLRRS